MKSALFAAAALALAATGAAAQMDVPPPLKPYVPTTIRPYVIGYLKAPVDKQASMEGMVAHLAYMKAQTQAGKYVLGGPFADQSEVRGILIINAPDVAAAKAIVEGDPLVKSGFFTYELRPVMLADASAVKTAYPGE